MFNSPLRASEWSRPGRLTRDGYAHADGLGRRSGGLQCEREIGVAIEGDAARNGFVTGRFGAEDVLRAVGGEHPPPPGGGEPRARQRKPSLPRGKSDAPLGLSG